MLCLCYWHLRRVSLFWLIVVFAVHCRGGAADDIAAYCQSGIAEDNDVYHQTCILVAARLKKTASPIAMAAQPKMVPHIVVAAR